MAEVGKERIKHLPGVVPFTERAIHEAKEAKDQYFLIQVGYGVTENGAHRVTVPRPEDRLLATKKEGRESLERDREGWRFAAGGALVILECADQTVALVRKRDGKIKNNPNKWTLGSGLSSSVDDLTNVSSLALREGIEEFIIQTPDGRVIPTFHNEEQDAISHAAVGATRHLVDEPHVPKNFKSGKHIEADASFDTVPGEETLEVVWEGENREPTQHRGLVVIDPETRGIDLLTVVRIKVPYRLEQLSFLDGEMGADRKSLDAPVGCLTVTETVDANGNKKTTLGNTFQAVFQHGVKQDKNAFQCDEKTPVLEAFFNAFNSNKASK